MQSGQIKKIFFGLPAYNEKDSIQPLFEKIHELKNSIPNDLEILFYDDGSVDGTKEAVKKWANKISITYLDGVVNKGLGTGINELVSFFVKNAGKNDGLIIMDCDDTHDPQQIPDMIKLIQQDDTDVVIASRYRKGAFVKGVPAHRVLLSIFAAILYKIIHPMHRVRDYTCGYRFYTYEALARAQANYSTPLLKEKGFACMVELLLKVKASGAKMQEVPLLLRYDNKRSKSKMDVLGNAFQLLKKLIDWRLREMK